jgi:hypothetical protein
MPPLGSNKKGLIKFFLAYFGDGEGSAGAVVVYESIHQHERDKCVSIEDFLDLFYDRAFEDYLAYEGPERLARERRLVVHQSTVKAESAAGRDAPSNARHVTFSERLAGVSSATGESHAEGNHAGFDDDSRTGLLLTSLGLPCHQRPLL